MPAGVFTCAELTEVKVKAEQIFGTGSQNESEFKVNTEIVNGIITEQTAQLADVQDSDKDKVVKVQWLQACDVDVQDCTDDCTISGVELGAECKDYELTNCKEVTFEIHEDKFRTSNFSKEEVLARALLKASSALDRYVEQTAISSVDALASTVNANTQFPIVGNLTEIPAVRWNENLLRYMTKTAILNRLENPYILSGDLLWDSVYDAQFDPTANSKLSVIRRYHDLFNVFPTLGEERAYLLSKGSTAFFSKARYAGRTETISNGADMIRTYIASNNISGLTYDMIYKTKCVGDEIIHCYKLKTRVGVFGAPTDCAGTGTGVLGFKCV